MPPYLAFMAGAAAGGSDAARQPAAAAGRGLLRARAVDGVPAARARGLGARAAVPDPPAGDGASPPGWSIVIFGLHFLGLLRIPLLDREARFEAAAATGTALGAYVFGLAFAFGWTPCIGPVLGAILALAAQGGSVGAGAAADGRLRGRARGAVPA